MEKREMLDAQNRLYKVLKSAECITVGPIENVHAWDLIRAAFAYPESEPCGFIDFYFSKEYAQFLRWCLAHDFSCERVGETFLLEAKNGESTNVSAEADVTESREDSREQV